MGLVPKKTKSWREAHPLSSPPSSRAGEGGDWVSQQWPVTDSCLLNKASIKPLNMGFWALRESRQVCRCRYGGGGRPGSSAPTHTRPRLSPSWLLLTCIPHTKPKTGSKMSIRVLWAVSPQALRAWGGCGKPWFTAGPSEAQEAPVTGYTVGLSPDLRVCANLMATGRES